MALPGTGAIIIWNDIAAEGREDFYNWHLNEHIPERLAVPGFLSGSRYIALTPETTPEFLTLYVTQNPAIATSAPYLERLNAPTPWTKRATTHFRNTSRALTRMLFSQGAGGGGVVGVLRFDGSETGCVASEDLAREVGRLESIVGMPRISGVHACLSDLAASGTKTAESRDRTDIVAAPSGALLIEGCDSIAVVDAMYASRRMFNFQDHSTQMGVYRLEHTRNIAH